MGMVQRPRRQHQSKCKKMEGKSEKIGGKGESRDQEQVVCHTMQIVRREENQEPGKVSMFEMI